MALLQTSFLIFMMSLWPREVMSFNHEKNDMYVLPCAHTLMVWRVALKPRAANPPIRSSHMSSFLCLASAVLSSNGTVNSTRFALSEL